MTEMYEAPKDVVDRTNAALEKGRQIGHRIMAVVAVKQPLDSTDMHAIGGENGVSRLRVEREVHVLSQEGLLQFTGLGYGPRELPEGLTVEQALERIYGPRPETTA